MQLLLMLPTTACLLHVHVTLTAAASPHPLLILQSFYQQRLNNLVVDSLHLISVAAAESEGKEKRL